MQGGVRRDPSGRLDRKRCQVTGLNQNYVSASGTLYHVQIEDLGPVVDRMSAPYLTGATIDFADRIDAQGFTIDNPNASGSCACGDSFH